MRRWSTLEPWEWRAELARVHPDLTEDALIACGLAVPELAPQIKSQKSKEDRVRVCLRYFGDAQHPQPPGQIRYGPSINGGGTPVSKCPRWEQLPPLEPDEQPAQTPATRSLPRAPLPNKSQLRSYTHGSLQKAVKTFAADHSKADVVRATAISPNDARRVRLMVGERLLRLNAEGKLVIDDRVARDAARYVLRYLDESGTRWLDPIKTLQGR